MLGAWQVLFAAALLALAVGTVAHKTLAGGRSSVPAAVRSHPFSRKSLLSLPLSAQGPVSAALGADGQAYRVSPSEGGFAASSPAQHLSAKFTSSGVSVVLGTTHLGLRLRAVGYGSSFTALSQVGPRADANRVLYAHRGLTEWYANGPLGLEQGFTLARAPRRHATGPLILSLALTGHVQVSLAQNGQSVLMHAGRTVFRYTGLAAIDARGRRLRSWIQLGHGELQLLVDASDAAYPIRVNPLVQQGGKLTGSGEGAAGQLGKVTLSTDGNTALVGAEDNAAWMFTRTGATWTQQGGKLTAIGETTNGSFGDSVALSADGNTAVIGGEADNNYAGAVWVFTRTGSTWTQQGEKLTAKTGEEIGSGVFGASVALSADGNTAMVGAPVNNNYLGAAWVFTRVGSTWTQQGEKLTGGGEGGKGEVGTSVSLSADGNTALIGSNDNVAWVYARTGSAWTQQGPYLAGAEEVGPRSQFGSSVALSSDGNIALIGGPYDGAPSGSQGVLGPGAAWIFTRTGGKWHQQGKKLTAIGEVGAGALGDSVALSSNGATALVGAPFDNGAIGAAWVFIRSGGQWVQEGEKLTAKGEVGEGSFGLVALSGDGNTALIGGPGDNGFQGAVWVFTNHTNGGGSGAPSVVTGGSSNVTSTAVTLNGSVIPGEDALKSCYFEYGESVNVYGSTVLCAQTVGAGASPVSVSASLTGLTPGTTYHVRLVVTSSAGTGYGSDVSFATTGTFTPTVQTGYAYGGWPSSATLTGGIDPHGNDVTYEFRYGAFSFPTVSSYGEILTGYWGSVAGSGALSGTTSQEVSANIGGLAADTPYYVRLVVFYDGLVTWGPEVRLEITPPEPQATEAPYLQVNGTDAAKGYRVRCQPGNWSYTNYNFETQWVYVAQNGGTSPARSGAGSGNEYQVDQSDIGHPLACLVTPYKLDGRLPSGPGNTTLQSDLLLPEGTGLLVIPSWLKTAWNVISTAHDVPSAWDAGVWCGAAVLVPEIFAVECLTNVTELVLSNALQDALGSVVDPPEANYQSVALPHPLVERERGKRPCPSNLKAGACGVLVRLANRYSGATARATGIIEAIAISRNRTLIARKKRDSETLVVQEAARKVYFGMLTIAIDEQRKAGALFAEGLHRLHADVRIPGARLRALPRHRGTAWERSLQRRMLTHGFDKASIRKAFTARPTSIRGFDLVRSLAIPAPPPAFTRYYDMLEINDVMTLVTELARQHALRSSSEPQLLIDLDKARAACTQTARSAAMQRFLQDTRLNLQPQFYSVLSTATQPLIDGSSKVNPYPRCLG